MSDSRTVYVLERRHPDGSLDLRGEQPPFLNGTLDDLTNHYFAQVKTGESASVETIRAWYASRGWTWRVNTWSRVRTVSVRGRGIVVARPQGESW